MSGGSYNYLCDREASELPARTMELQDMVKGLRARGYEPEARETENIVEQINLFQQTMEARARDLRKVWKAVEWQASGDWGTEEIDRMVAAHRRDHPEATRVPGLPNREWETGATPEERAQLDRPRFANRYARCDSTEAPAQPRPRKVMWQGQEKYTVVIDPETAATTYTREELEWMVWAAGEALRHQGEDRRWEETRRAELIAQFNGGPIDPGAGYPIPTMGLQAVEYIIATEREKRHQ